MGIEPTKKWPNSNQNLRSLIQEPINTYKPGYPWKIPYRFIPQDGKIEVISLQGAYLNIDCQRDTEKAIYMWANQAKINFMKEEIKQ